MTATNLGLRDHRQHPRHPRWCGILDDPNSAQTRMSPRNPKCCFHVSCHPRLCADTAGHLVRKQTRDPSPTYEHLVSPSMSLAGCTCRTCAPRAHARWNTSTLCMASLVPRICYEENTLHYCFYLFEDIK